MLLGHKILGSLQEKMHREHGCIFHKIKGEKTRNNTFYPWPYKNVKMTLRLIMEVLMLTFPLKDAFHEALGL